MSNTARRVVMAAVMFLAAGVCAARALAITFECKAECAIQWAQSCPPKDPHYRCETPTWGNCCLGFVEEAYGKPGWLDSACQLLSTLQAQGQIHADTNAPRGALVFWKCELPGSGGYGHVGIALGNGRFISALITTPTRCPCDICEKDLTWASRYWAGWAYPPGDWPGRPGCVCCTAPGAPSLLSPLTGACSWFKHDAPVTLQVSPGSGGAPTQYNYHVWRDQGGYDYRGTNANLGTPGWGTYHWTASASNSCGTGPENPAPQSFDMNDPPDPPSPVSTATAYSRSFTVPLTWTGTAGDNDGTQYGLWYSLNIRRGDGGWWTETGFAAGATQTTRNVTVPLEGLYYWSVAAGEGPWPDCRGGGWDTLGFGPEGSFIVDMRAPQYLSHCFSPESPGRSDSVAINARAADTNPDSTITVSGVKTITALMDGVPVGVIPGPQGSLVWDTTSVPEGWYGLTLIIVDNAGNSTVKAFPSAYLLDKTPPIPPPNVRGEGGPHLVDLAWDETTDAWTDVQGYNVYRALSPEGPYEKVNATLIPAYETSFRDDNNGAGLVNVIRYWYKVTAVDSANPGGNENPVPSIAAVPVTAGIRGDITGDDLVDIQDVVRCIRIAVGRDWPTDGQADLADLNKDTLVDVADVILDIRKALAIAGSAQVRAGEPSMSDARTKPLLAAPWTSPKGVSSGLSGPPKQPGGAGSVFVPPVIRARAGSVATVPLYLRRVSGVAGIQVSVGLDQRFLRLVSVSKGELIADLPAWSLYVNPSAPQPSILATAGLSLQPISTGARSCILSLSLAVQGPSRKIGRVPITLRGKLVDDRGNLLAVFDCRTTVLVF